MSKKMVIRGAKEHNLKNVSVEIPRGAMTVITGVSGSGKSSLAFDTIFQEGQRKYVESLSAYARQFIGAMGRPNAEEISGISPTISIDQKTVNRNARSTVGTVTEITDHLRLLFARLGEPHCPTCSTPIKALSLDQVCERLMADWPEQTLWVMAPIVRERKGEYRKEIEELRATGFPRVRIDGTVHRLDQDIPLLARYEKHTIELVIDRIKLESRNQSRLREALELAQPHAGDVLSFFVEEGEQHFFLGTKLACPKGHGSLPELEPRLFSFNDPQGQCPECKGLGRLYRFTEELVIDPAKSIKGGAIRPLMSEGHLMFSDYGMQEYAILARHYKFSLDTPWQDLGIFAQDLILNGSPDELEFSLRRGRKILSEKRRIRGTLEVLQRVWDMWRPPMMKKYLEESPCSACAGARLNPGALAVQFGGLNIDQLSRCTIADARQFFAPYPRSEREARIGSELFKEIQGRLHYLEEVGLGYLSLDRAAPTLSGGESQRIRLASQVGAGLNGVTYVLDEPSIGLHPRDNQKLLKSLDRLRSLGNTLIVVEHDEETMLQADYLVDVGPGAGIMGGQIIAAGKPADVLADPNSQTALYLNGTRKIEVPQTRRPTGEHWIEIRGAREHNLKNVDLKIPLGIFVAVTGVSGSGKSTLIHDILGKALAQHFDGSMDEPGAHDSIQGLEHIHKAITIDQDPIGRTPRSNPATYTKVFDEIRNLFADLPESKLRGYAKGRFSFNVAGGRCDECEGSGYKEVEMQLLPNVQVPCEACGTKRFNAATLEVHYKGRTIADVLELSISEALEFFQAFPKITKGLQTLENIGLGYIKLGQPSTTLSGGEAQRIKMASELQKKPKGHCLYLLDEPTTGLHFEDIQKLVHSLEELVSRGNTVLVIEHNLDVVKRADYILDIGPEGGAGGGQLLATGTPEQIAKHKKSLTGKFLAPLLKSDYKPVDALKSTPAWEGESSSPCIEIRGARKHNLKNIDVKLPHSQLIGICGPSGAGKSTLALDTLFSEGQRRFVESLSTYARRFLGQPDRGGAQAIEGLCPAIAIDQKSANRSPRSTVATMTEIYDHFRLLFARIGIPHSPASGEILVSHNPRAMKSFAEQLGSQILVLAPLDLPKSNKDFLLKSKKQWSHLAGQMQELGYQRVLRIHAQKQDILRLEECSELQKWDELYLIADRLDPSQSGRLMESMEKALEQGHGVLGLCNVDGPIHLLSALPCHSQERYFLDAELEPKHFSFNSHWGACNTCQGIGYLAKGPCPECHGERLKVPYSLVKIGGASIAQITRMTVSEAQSFFAQLQLEGAASIIARPVLREIEGRLDFLVRVGLGYLNLNRTGDTLSGGEAQRIRLAGQIGSGLEGVLYVLDEPTTGLHQRDTQRLLQSLYRLRDLGNTVVVVEHDLELLASCDHLIDMGPGAGELGGEICAQGDLDQLCQSTGPTAPYLREGLVLNQVPAQAKGQITLKGASKHNLQKADLQLQMGAIHALSGVSGSGKSTLALECLAPLLESHLAGKKSRQSELGKLDLDFNLGSVVLVDQSPISGTPRSTPVSYTKLLDKLRDLFAALPDAKIRGFSRSRFSYNMHEGRCPACEGRGATYLEMHFLSDVWEVCESCKGKRYNSQTLEVKFKGKSIADVLDLTFDEAVLFFEGFKAFQPVLQAFVDLGLGYLKLGQPVTTMSGGENQRLKLATELGKKVRSQSLYILDEPTTGLHPVDVEKLWQCLQVLKSKGHGILLIEHHAEMLRACDSITDLGPEGGAGGGQVLFSGHPSAMQGLQTATAQALWANTPSQDLS